MVARVLGAAPILADAIIDQLAAPSDKAVNVGVLLLLPLPHWFFWQLQFCIEADTRQRQGLLDSSSIL